MYLVLKLFLGLVRVKPQVNQSVGIYTDLLLIGNDNVEEMIMLRNWTLM